MENKSCKVCGLSIKGRTDKVFCSDMCRNVHHNRRRGETTAYVRSINYILRRNRMILEELFPGGARQKLPSSRLISKGFDFRYFTHFEQDRSGRTHYYCYEFGYYKLDSESFRITLQEP